MTTGEKIKQLRRGKHMTQEELGIQLGVTKGTISRYEKDIVILNADYIKKIAETFGVSSDYLLVDHDDNKSSSQYVLKEIREVLLESQLIRNRQSLTISEKQDLVKVVLV